ncbi:interferon-induced very large GTPase 1-like [Megalops cyprinoides]|uniref:interferon-induced very large GTPase 1-like n=1 Tax=Megalops cyprinoides TaxID=118141 RepID=UPI00186444BE|nr:interferon-induced very large GTPase 1-like [Megalops cyprinoides]
MDNSNQPKKRNQLALDYIHQLMMLDCNARYIGTKSSAAVCEEKCSTVESGDDFLNTESDDTEEDENQGIHPMDIHIAVFLCADDFLRQYICTKLAMCQFALPLLVPDPGTGEVEFPLWALRQVRKSWKCRQESAGTAVQRYDDQLMSSTPAPIISFIRLGSSSQSKSQILNNIISKQKHDVFFHRHCRGSTPNRSLMDGVVEVSWYLPGGRRDDTFDSCVAFMNLHGDASKHPRQLEFLQDVSTVNLVLLSENGLDEEAKRISKALFDSPVPLICLFSGKEKVLPGPNRTRVRLAVKNKNEALLSDEITHHIKRCVNYQLKKNREPQKNSLEKCLGAGKKHFKVDEEKYTCKLGHSRAQVLMNLLGQEQNEPPIAKRTCFPLQAKRKQIGDPPAIAAELLILGYPLELMDGETAHVPLVWISSVLDKLITLLGDKKVFVLSVLGLQSSGKPTLLNTMFGLQFAASAGRCTRGAFMQLLTVDAEMREQLQYDLILVVDTEGLRPPELSPAGTLTHDNELATFIVGLSNMALINIMGENTCEMQDILQICVQAFMRMKSIKMKPSCIFVHQNIADTSAHDKNKEGKRRLLENLDKMTRTAAKEENREFSSFSDIIQFDVDSQVFYFKNLLEGDPPMAPPNLSYSQNVQELKEKVLSIARWQKDCTLLSLSEFKIRLTDLWDALLKENFVFSFRNTLEIMVYNKLEENYAKWSWRLRKHALETESRLHNQIMSGQLQSVDMAELKRDFDGIHKELKDEIDRYFKEEKHIEILIQWRANIDKRMEMLRSELTEETENQCKELLSSRRSRAELDKRKSEYEKDLLTRSKTLASKLQDKKLSDDEIRKEFNTLWVAWSSDVSSETLRKQPINVKAVVENTLLKRFEKNTDIINDILEKREQFEFKLNEHVKLSHYEHIKAIVWLNAKEHTGKKLTQKIQDEVNRCIMRREEKKMDFSENFIYELLDKIEHDISVCEKEEKIQFQLKYKVGISVHTCTKAIERFEKMHEKFQKANDPLTYFNSQREDYFQIFKQSCEGASSVVIFVHLLCNQLKTAMQQASYDKSSVQIVHDLKSNHEAFSGNRSNLEEHILKDLAEKENFDLYIEYMDQPERYVQFFITKIVVSYSEDSTNTAKILNDNLSLLTDEIVRTVNTVTDAVIREKGNVSMWLDEFCSQLGNHMAISREDVRNTEREDITDLLFLKNTLVESLLKMVENVKEENKKSLNLGMFRKRPDEMLFQQMSGCWEQCPFCKAVCTNTMPNHDTDHCVEFHRPRALAGMYYSNTENFCLDFCTSAVISDEEFKPHPESKWIPFKKYREAGPPYGSWNITPDGSEKCYWKWFIYTFRSKLEEKYKLKFKGKGIIPGSWTRFTKQDALQEVDGGINNRKNMIE